MATYTDNYQLTKPTYAEQADIGVINSNMNKIDEIMHSSQISLADAYDSTQTYAEGDVVMYEFLMYKCKEDNVTGNWDATKWERTTAAEAGGEASDLSVKVPKVISTGDKACYVKRAIPTAGALAEGQKIVGATLAWNQLVQNGNFASTSGWVPSSVTFSVSGNKGLVTATARWGRINGNNISITADHKYLMSITINGTTDNYYGVGNSYTYYCDTNGKKTYNKIFNATNSESITSQIGDRRSSGWTQIEVEKFNLIDLTQLFGSTIADAIYQMEQTTAGSGVAFFRKYFPVDYYAYDAGSLQSVNVSAHKAYDENATEISSITLDSSKELRGLFNLIDGELRADGDEYTADGTVTRKYGIVDLGTLDWTIQSYQGVNYFRSSTPNGAIAPISGGTMNYVIPIYDKFQGILSDFIQTDKSVCYASSNIVSGSARVAIRDSSYVDAPTFKTAMNGVYLVYELATPTTETATPYTNPQLVDADGTEEFVDYKVSQGTRDVAIPVGHESSFYDYTDGTITIPDLPFADGTYALSVTMNNGTPTFSWEGGN